MANHTRTIAGVWGLAAALIGVLAGQITSIFAGPSSSPMDAVGGFVIDITPPPVKDWAVSTFGTADKAFLLVVIAVVVAALIGLLVPLVDLTPQEAATLRDLAHRLVASAERGASPQARNGESA